MSEPWLLIETSGRGGHIGLAVGGSIASAALDPARRHNRDLMPTVDRLLRDAGLATKDLHGVMVSVGPGSYTGLRVGVMSAKVLAYATGCRLVAVPTFQAIAEQAPGEISTLHVIADALKGLVYSQHFHRGASGEWLPKNELRIEPVEAWAARLGEGWVSGPGVEVNDARILAEIARVPREHRMPGVAALYRAGLRFAPLTMPEVMGLEPLYLRPSSAEEQSQSGGVEPTKAP